MSWDQKHFCRLCPTRNNSFPGQVYYFETFSNLRNYIATKDNLCHWLLAEFLYNLLHCLDKDFIDVTADINI